MDDLTKLYQVKRTVTQMLHDRGYIVSQAELDQTKEEFKAKYSEAPSREALTIVKRNKDDPTDQICVFFPDERKVGMKTIANYVERMKEAGINRAIIVVQESMTAFAKRAVSEMPLYHMEQALETELLVNITQHQLVPKHVVLSPEEKKELLERYKLRETQLPRMQVTDPIARYFGMRRGNVVKIIRPSETAGKYITYRLVQ